MIQKIKVEEFLTFSKTMLLIDVRSPGEYSHAHIPCAYSLPLFTDEERKIVGTAYKQESRAMAIKKGLDFFGGKMRKMVEEVETLGDNKSIIVHCWRGGMRSAAVAWLLDVYGYKVYTLAGGYKAYRNWVLAQFIKPYPFKIIGGYTGSGKTLVLQQMALAGLSVIDLEAIAHHKGSAFGQMEGKQPTQEMFENLLATQCHEMSLKTPHNGTIWIEDESQRIGLVNLPNAFWATMRNAQVCFLEVPFEHRLKHIVAEYSKLPKPFLIDAVSRIQKRLGGLEAKNATNYLLTDNYTACFAILLKYYDKHYAKALINRERWNELVTYIKCNKVEANNYKKLM